MRTIGNYCVPLCVCLFFDAKIFYQMQLVSIELRKVYRQSDPTFISILDHIRTSQVSTTDLALLNERVTFDDNQATETTNDKQLSITLSARRDTVDFINNKRLSDLSGDSEIFMGIIEGEFQSRASPPQRVGIEDWCAGALRQNDIDHRWVNGTLGTVIGSMKKTRSHLCSYRRRKRTGCGTREMVKRKIHVQRTGEEDRGARIGQLYPIPCTIGMGHHSS